VTVNKKPRIEPELKYHLPEGNRGGRAGQLKLHGFFSPLTRSFGRSTNRPSARDWLGRNKIMLAPVFSRMRQRPLMVQHLA
jgi:hypothetical protein